MSPNTVLMRIGLVFYPNGGRDKLVPTSRVVVA
jgi:hypothetical protein